MIITTYHTTCTPTMDLTTSMRKYGNGISIGIGIKVENNQVPKSNLIGKVTLTLTTTEQTTF